jgi:hypothetical protein
MFKLLLTTWSINHEHGGVYVDVTVLDFETLSLAEKLFLN